MPDRQMLVAVLAIAMYSAEVAPAAESSAEAAAVESAMQQYGRYQKAMDASALAASYTADGELLEPGLKPLRGRAAIQAFLASFTGVRVESSTMQSGSIEVWGSDALQWGSYAQTVVIEGKPPAEYRGRFVAQWRKQSSGKWLIRRLMTQPLQE